MDAKSRAKFINSVANGQKIPCPKCNTLNESESNFCISCGNELIQEIVKENDTYNATKQKKDLPFNQVENIEQAKEKVNVLLSSVKKSENSSESPKSVFAQGLPSWDIVPPQVMVRRKK